MTRIIIRPPNTPYSIYFRGTRNKRLDYCKKLTREAFEHIAGDWFAKIMDVVGACLEVGLRVKGSEPNYRQSLQRGYGGYRD